MDKEKALNILIANAVCYDNKELNCIDHCPLYDKATEDCKYDWEEKVSEAVKTIITNREEKETDEKNKQ